QPALQMGQTPFLSSAIPGVRSSSGMNRISWFSGLVVEHAAMAVAPPVTAVSLMKDRRSIPLEVAGQAVVGRLPCLVTVHAEPHGVIDVPRRDRAAGDVAVTGGAVDVIADVRRVVEAHVHFRREAVDTLPGQVHA